jgi:hypothetical protein
VVEENRSLGPSSGLTNILLQDKPNKTSHRAVTRFYESNLPPNRTITRKNNGCSCSTHQDLPNNVPQS